jgi:hypothetical protein
MEFVNLENIITAVVVLLMIGCLVKTFKGDIGTNRAFYIIVLIVLGIGLYLWRSGEAVRILNDFTGAVK